MEDGAYAANVFTMMYSSILAASVLRGDSSVSEEFLDIVKILPSDGNRDIRKSDNPIPVWLIGEDRKGPSDTIAAHAVPKKDTALETLPGSICRNQILS